MTAIRNPIEWTLSTVKLAGVAVETAGRAVAGSHETAHTAPLAVRHIKMTDLKDVLEKGVEDFVAYRTDVIFLCVIYPVIGLILAKLAFNRNMLHLLFPLASGFALIGPFAAIGLYELSRRRETAAPVAWKDAFTVLRAPAFGKIMVLGILLVAIFLLWIATALGLYVLTLGPTPPSSIGSFARELFTTGSGWALIVLGVGIGFLFALLVLAIGTVSFPLLLDRDVSLGAAIGTSVRALETNPREMAVWGLIVAGSLVIGSIPLLLGLIFAMPVLGHATWHLYRKVVPL
jgi:uncharacterized membrane protein